MQKTICQFTSVHPRGDTRVFVKECSSLAARGYAVTLVVADGLGDQVKNGVTILDVGKDHSSRLSRMTKTVKKVYKKALALNSDVYHFHDPELLFAGWLLKLKGNKVVYDVHENASATFAYKHYLPFLLRKMLSFTFRILEKTISRKFDLVVAATPNIAKLFKNRNCVLVQNFPILGELIKPNPTEYTSRPAQGFYVGAISHERGIVGMISAFSEKLLKQEVRLRLGGAFEDQEIEEEVVKLEGWNNVDRLNRLNREQITEECDLARFGLIVNRPIPNLIDAYPTKMFEYMGAGVPVISSNFPIYKGFIDDAQCGLTVDPDDTAAITDAINWIMANPQKAKEMGQNGIRAAREKYNWEIEFDKLVKAIKRI